MMVWFETILVALTLLTGLVWLLDKLFLAKRRAAAAGLLDEVKEPLLVDYSKAFFPVLALVLVLAQLRRRAVPDPVQLDDADPADRRLHPGQQVQLRPAPADHQQEVRRRSASRRAATWWCSARRTTRDEDWIKRVIGVPGDVIGYHDHKISVNGQVLPYRVEGVYTGVGQGAAKPAQPS